MVTWNIWVSAGNSPDGTILHYGEGYCLSTDIKPTEGIFNGSSLFELDTSSVFGFNMDSSQWMEL